MSVGRRSEPAADVRLPVDTTGRGSPATGTTREAGSSRTPAPIALQSLEEAEEQYVICRDAWTAAMRRANSGRAADLASLAIVQEAYELATAEVERWRSGDRVAITIEPETRRAGIEAAIGQEMAWRRVHETKEKQPGGVSRLVRRITGRR